MSSGNKPSLATGDFAGAASAYVKYRPAYPDAVIRAIVDQCRLDGAGRILDVGCGPGLLSVPLSRFADEVIALDIDKEMIATAHAEAARRNIRKISYRVMGSEEISPDLGFFRAVVFGNSFHWMDRLPISQKLRSQLLKDGHIAILTGFYIWHGNEEWKQVTRKTISEFTGEDRSNGMNVDPSDSGILSEAGYGDIQTFVYEAPQAYSLSSLMGFLASTSYASRRKLGAKADAFEHTLRQRLQDIGDMETYTETAKFTLITATRD